MTITNMGSKRAVIWSRIFATNLNTGSKYLLPAKQNFNIETWKWWAR